MADINSELIETIRKENGTLYTKLMQRETKQRSILNLPLTRIAEVKPYSSGLKIESDPIEVIVIGAGGTGGYLIRDLCRFLYSAERRVNKLDVSITIYDGDIVEEKNILRQNFLPQDIGQNKAEVLANRHSRAFGINVNYVPSMFKADNPWSRNMQEMLTDNRKRIFIGCVDNNAARREIASTITDIYNTNRYGVKKDCWWIDSGNERKSGQVIVGSKDLMDVTDLYPEILTATQDSRETISCADRMLEDEQNMFVNLTAANLILNYTRKLLLDESLITNGAVFNIDNKFDNYYILDK